MFDWEEFNLIAHFVKPGDVVGDVGSNMGIYTVWMSKFIDNGTIHSFEPDTLNYEKLKENITLNHLEKSTHLNKLGLSNEVGTVSFTSGLDGENHIAIKNESNIVPISVTTLDTYADENGILFFSYLKIDVEGFEYTVLQGAEKLLQEKRIKIIQLELNNTIINSGLKMEAITQLLQEFNYILCGYNVTSNKLEVVELNPLRENYFAVSDIHEANRRLNPNA